ncbi:MAG: DUF3141 domain-containing protein [Geminicoccaceae bacterium]
MHDKTFQLDVADHGTEVASKASKAFEQANFFARRMGELAEQHVRQQTKVQEEDGAKLLKDTAAFYGEAFNPLTMAQDYAAYMVDSMQRSILYWDIMRERGNEFVKSEESGGPKPLLIFDYEMVLDGKEMPRPVNYALVKIVPPEGVQIDPNARPYLIIDPRAGHGSGIGGFKDDSQVGVALRAGHPVYFVIFYPRPVKGQTILDVCRAEGEFLKKIHELHPNSEKPVVIGNCQGGWATMMLGASHPDYTGPIVINGAPMSYWAGENGKNPMRYTGGLAGGSWPALMLATLGNGVFDGAWLVYNFENLNPANTLWTKQYNVYARADSERERFLDFERWWGGFYFMNEEEIRWIVDNLFVGNKFSQGKVEIEGATYFDLREIRSPIIVFASEGDNITPPQQALNWIADVYRDVHEIKALGQRIIYLVHESIGHLGIFVSGGVARKEHTQIVDTLKSIEALAPGLYEMVITDKEGEGEHAKYSVSLEEREISDILARDDTRDEERAFEPVQKFSSMNEKIFDMFVKPRLQMMTSDASAELFFKMNPLRLQRYLISDKNPMFSWLPPAVQMVESNRKPITKDNPFLRGEQLMSRWIEHSLNSYRDMRDAGYEMAFYSVYGTLAVMGANPQDTLEEQVEELPSQINPLAQAALDKIDEGGYPAGVVRMLILLAKSRGGVRRSRLERSNTMLQSDEAFRNMDDMARSVLINQQSLIVAIEPERALEHLPVLFASADERARALAVCEEIAGPRSEMSEATVAMFDRLYHVLDVQGPTTAAQAAE